MSDVPPRVPLVLLTGFLGAGKTTLLNRVLAAQHHRRVAVIVNELGRIDIDGKLLKSRSGDVVELAGGCVCHEVRTQEELWGGIDEVLARSAVECIVLETTGIAEPQSIWEGLRELPDDRRRVFASGVVTVVDAEVGSVQLQRHAEARAQVRGADRLLLSKLDRASTAAVTALHTALHDLNPLAERAHFPNTDEGTTALVPWLLDHRLHEPAAQEEPGQAHHPHLHGQLVVASFVDDHPLLAAPLLAVCERLGTALVRAKGFVQLAEENRRGFLERAGGRLELRLLDEWPPGPRRTELVFIGEDLDPVSLRRQIWACRAGGPSHPGSVPR